MNRHIQTKVRFAYPLSIKRATSPSNTPITKCPPINIVLLFSNAIVKLARRAPINPESPRKVFY
jgi:hypothetical protein